MSGFMAYEHQVQVRGADGTILWVGTALMGVSYHVLNNEASASIEVGEGVRMDTGATSVLPRLEVTAAGASPTADLPQYLVVAGLRIASATDTNFLGVAMERIPAGKVGVVAGVGSLTTVKTTAASIAVTTTIGGSGTAGLAGAVTTATMILGTCMKNNAVASPGTGSTAFAGILVSPR
jgi:hypothetical protein